MTTAIGVLLCLTYVLGLLLTVLLSTAAPWMDFWVVALAIGGVGVGATIIVPQFWRTGPKRPVWFIAALIGLLAPLYFYMMTPKVAANDVSKFIAAAEGKAQEQVVTVRGQVEDMPSLTRSKRARFFLKATQLDEVTGATGPPKVGQVVTGKLYVTVPLLQATGLHPGQTIAVTGSLYQPKPPANPGAFDFQAYLARQGVFAGLRGRQVRVPEEKTGFQWRWWAIRQRIIRAHVNWLGVPEGPLVSSMVMGRKAVDLPYDIRDRFIQAGLAHVLAASGFHVSLILGLVLALTRRFSERTQFTAGVSALIIFVGLTGLQPSVLRAAFMGFAALLGLVLGRKVKPLGSLLVAATLLLLFNPLWIEDLGFQLSFLATLGLVVTVPPLTKRLDGLPPAIASLIAVPLAASVWTLPLQLFVFGIVASYSILINILTTPLIALISIGGVLSALVALIWPLAGSALAWLLYYPTHFLIALVNFFTQLPGNSVALGTISLAQLIALYGLIGLVWLVSWFHARWWLAGLVAVGLIVTPVWWTSANLFRVTMLATSGEPILAIQDQGKVTLMNAGDTDTARYTVLPFLQQQGINRINWAIANDSQLGQNNGWSTILERLPVSTFYGNNRTEGQTLQSAVQARQGSYQALPAGQAVQTGSIPVKLINAQVPLLQFEIQGQNWLLLGDLNPELQKRIATLKGLPKVEVLAWSGKRLSPDLLRVLQPKVAIASSPFVDSTTVAQLIQSKTQVYLANRDGAIQWTPHRGFETTVDLTENDASLL